MAAKFEFETEHLVKRVWHDATMHQTSIIFTSDFDVYRRRILEPSVLNSILSKLIRLNNAPNASYGSALPVSWNSELNAHIHTEAPSTAVSYG